MCRLILLLTIFFLSIVQINSQVETIPADHEVYPFLKAMFLKGSLTDYDDEILPLSKSQVTAYLEEIKNNDSLLTEQEKEFLYRMEVKMGTAGETPFSYLEHFPTELISNFTKYNQKHLFFYNDSTASLNIDLLGDVTYLYSNKYKDEQCISRLESIEKTLKSY